MPPPALIVHGGAWDIPDPRVAASRAGALAALEVGWALLAEGGSALDAVCAAVVALEDNPIFNAGIGASLNAAGQIELDASIMVGEGYRAGAVAAIRDVRNPILVARRVMETTQHVLLAGEGACAFAAAEGFDPLPAGALEISEQRSQLRAIEGRDSYHASEPFRPLDGPGDTVGAAAVDRGGQVVAATSTGGVPAKMPGRVGDSPLIGAGTWAAPEGGVSCTGWGEAIIRTAMAYRAGAALEAGAAAEVAAQQAVAALERIPKGRAGLILVDRHGRVAHAFNTPRMAWASRTSDGATGSGPE